MRGNYVVSIAAVERLHDTAGGHLRARLESAGRWPRSSSVSCQGALNFLEFDSMTLYFLYNVFLLYTKNEMLY